MLHIKRLDHIQLCIPIGKEMEARQFYSHILGFREIPKPKELVSNGGLWYQVGDIQLHIGTEMVTNQSKQHPAFEVTNLLEDREWLEQNGIVIKDEIRIPGLIRFSFKDPFGNRIELLQKS